MGYKITSTELTGWFGAYKDICYVHDNGEVTEDQYSREVLCRISPSGCVYKDRGGSSILVDVIGEVCQNGAIRNEDGKLLCWIHSDGNICDTYPGGSLPRILGHIIQDGKAIEPFQSLLIPTKEDVASSKTDSLELESQEDSYIYPQYISRLSREELKRIRQEEGRKTAFIVSAILFVVFALLGFVCCGTGRKFEGALGAVIFFALAAISLLIMIRIGIKLKS